MTLFSYDLATSTSLKRSLIRFSTAELKLLIMEHLPDWLTLCALIETSESMQDLYFSNCNQITTAVTINELLNRNIPILTPAPLLEVGIRSKRLPKALRPALKTLKEHLETTHKIPVLDPVSCGALRQLSDLIRWDLEPGKARFPKVEFAEVPVEDNWYWRKAFGAYHVVYLGDGYVNMDEIWWDFEAGHHRMKAEWGRRDGVEDTPLPA